MCSTVPEELSEGHKAGGQLEGPGNDRARRGVRLWRQGPGWPTPSPGVATLPERYSQQITASPSLPGRAQEASKNL